MKIYLASSWRNAHQPYILAALRAAGHEVYDFRNPSPGNDGFRWSEIDPNWQNWTPEQYHAALNHPIAERGFGYDMTALRDCDACVLVLPCGRSAHLELGYAVGAGKKTYVLQLEPQEPELMVKMCTGIFSSLLALIEALKEKKDGDDPAVIAKKPTPTSRPAREYVLVRASAAGVHAGELVSRNGNAVTLANARRIWRWDTRQDEIKAYTLSDVSKIGAGSGGRISAPVEEIVILGACEIITCSPHGERALREAPLW